MSLYGDLPPPSTAATADGPSKKADGDAKDGAAASGAAKSVLPAGWSSSITRLKPMLNRKLAPPKARPAQRTIPVGFAAQSAQEPHKDVATMNPGITAVAQSIPGNNVTALSTGAQHASGNTLDENSWLKARTAQVQRNDNDVHAIGRKQMKRAPVKAQQQQGPISLDDEYDISRPNEYDDFKTLFDEEWKSRAEERKRLQGQGRYGRSEFRHTGTPSPSRSRSHSRSWSRSRSRSRSPSRSRSRSGSRQKSWSPELRSRSRRMHSRSVSRSPPPREHGSGSGRNQPSTPTKISQQHRSRSRSRSRNRGRGRSKSPYPRSRSPPPSFSRRRSRSPMHRNDSYHSSTPPKGEQRPLSYKAFAPPSSQTTPSHVAGQSLQRKLEIPSPPGQNRGVAILNDTSGEDAFLRRAQLTQQRLSEQASMPSTPSAPTHAPAQGHQQNQLYNRLAFTPKASEQTARKGSPSPVILLTNMVGPGEVDDTLQEETAMECEKFGPVVRCLIFEVQNGKVPPEEAVRIFVKFGSLVSAEKALKDLDGRFFGGRQVRGQFFDEKRFDSLQLAP